VVEDTVSPTRLIGAKLVVGDLLKKSPPSILWRGGGSTIGWITSWLPHGTLDGMIKKMKGLYLVEKVVRASRGV
jgi:1-acylglycerone phosphate reductase